MSGYLAFVHKEGIESLRTYRLLILALVFFIFGMMSPLSAKFLPEIISAMDMGGMQITLPTPTIMDSYMQFFKNVPQLGLVVFVLVIGSSLSGELSKGTLINMLTKGLMRKDVILAKFSVLSGIWTFIYGIALLTNYLYTMFFFPNENLPNLALALFCVWLFGILLIALVLFGSTLLKHSYGSLLFVFIVVLVLLLANIFPPLQSFNPIYLISENVSMLLPSYDTSNALLPIGTSILSTLVLLASSILLFQKKQL